MTIVAVSCSPARDFVTGDWRKLPQSHFAAFTLYLTISLLLVGWPVLAHPATLHVGLGADPSVMMWCIVWWPYALVHRLNPFISKLIWAPTGFNLTWSTSIPAVALALTPITSAFGPVISYNIAAVLAPAISAWSAFALCQWLTGNFAAAFVGGLLYGFSPYEVGHIVGGHLSFTVNFVPPLCLLLFGRLLERSIKRTRFVLVFAGLLVIQCLTSNEVFATMTAFGIVAWLAAYALFPAERRPSLKSTVAPLAAGYLVAAIILSPFFYFALANSAVPRQPLFPPSFFSADLIGFVVPTPLLLLASHSIEALTSRSFGNIQENEFYVGLPLVVLVGRFLWVRWREPFIRFLGVMFGVTVVAALGPILHVADHSLTQLPWASAFELPLLKQALPVRFANYGFIVIALIASMSLAAPKLRFSNVLIAYGLAALLPNPAILSWPGRYKEPPFFTAGRYREILHRGENIVIFPYGDSGPSMMWQAQSGMYFSMSGGYIGLTPEDFERWPVVNAAIVGLPLADPGMQLRSFLAAHHVKAVVAADGPTPLTAALEIKPIELGGVSVYRLPSRTSATASDQTVEQLEQAAAQEWMGDLLEAARRFLASGHDLATLNPAKLHQLGFLPKSRWGRTLDMVLACASHAAITGLWVGPGPERTVAVGLFASPPTVADLAVHYRGKAISILYPYPVPFTGALPRDDRIDFILITLPLDFVRSGLDAFSPSSFSRTNAVKSDSRGRRS